MDKKSNVSAFFSRNVREIAIAAIIIIVAIVVQFRTGGGFFTKANLYDLTRESAIIAMVSMALMLVVLTGCIDISIGSTMGLCGMLGALILKDHHDINLVVLFVIAIAIGAVCGLINGFVVARLHVFPLIATLATEYIYRGVIYLFSHGQWVAQAEMTPGFINVAVTKILGINSLVWFAIFIVVMTFLFTRFTPTGRSFYAVGNSVTAAEVTGINPRRVKMLAYTLCGAICGLAGLLWICKYGNAQSESCEGYEITIIAAVAAGGCNIAGGAGTVAGVLLGAMLMGTLNNILPLIQVSTYWQQAIKGAVILISVIINALTQERVKHNELKRRVL